MQKEACGIKDKRNLGYVSEKDNIVLARLMDAGKLQQLFFKHIFVHK